VITDLTRHIRIFNFRILHTLSQYFRIIPLSHFIHDHFRIL